MLSVKDDTKVIFVCLFVLNSAIGLTKQLN